MIIIPANTISGGYEVANSLRFDDGSSDSLNRTNTSSGSRKVFTFSCWFKKSTLGSSSDDQMIFSSWDGSNGIFIQIDSNDLLQIYSKVGGVVKLNVTSEMVFRDVSAWYHIVVKFDSNNTNLDLYVNGVEISQTVVVAFVDADHEINESGGTHYIGTKPSDRLWEGYMSEVCLIDGQALDPTSFGEFDEDTNIWKPINVSGLTFGTNGFYLDFENSGSLGADVSGNGNNFTVNNLTSIDQSTDTCTNNFATMNPLNVPTSNAPTFAEGNLETESATTSGQRFMGSSTIGLTDGKWYAECKIVVIDSATVGVSPDVQAHALDNTYIGSHQYDYSILPSSGAKYNNDNGTTHGDAFSTNDILMIALDLDNNNVYFGRNGNWFDGSGNANQSSPSSALSLTDPPSTPDGAYFFACSDGGGSAKAKVQWNFGSPPFSISSGNSDGNGYGNFEHTVPSGYYSLNSKNLAEYG